ncbi:MAG: SMC-Scp complex subunit ScpB [Pirellulaceae bacterium]
MADENDETPDSDESRFGVTEITKHDIEPQDEVAEDGEFSLEDLSRAYAKIISEQRGEHPSDDDSDRDGASADDDVIDDEAEDERQTVPVDEFSIVEAILFVGVPDGEKLTPRKIAASMRDISPKEIKSIVAQLNKRYERDGTPYRIVYDAGGYSMKLDDAFGSIRERFYGEVREAELNQQAIEVLSIVAYRQPVTKNDVDLVRQKPSGSLLKQLVSRNLLTIESDELSKTNSYRTSPRFLELLGLEQIEDLPHAQDVDDIDEFFDSDFDS